MIVCITEKPSVGRDIAKLLGATTRHDGYYEGKEYCVTWTFGHLCTLKDPADYTPNWKRWSLGSLPMIPPRFGIKLIDDTGIKKQFKVIESLIGRADMVVNCGDAGQEGELIQRWVMQKARCNKPVKRLWISSLTDEAIREGFNNLRPQADFDLLYQAGLCRAIGDWLLGLNSTRLYTLRYGQRGTVLSIGRVQTPTLALIVKRQAEIENFVPETTWEVKTLYRDVLFTATNRTYKTEEEGRQFIETLKSEPLTVTDVAKKKGKEPVPRLFDLTSLQVECNKKFGLSADATLRTIQSLYEKKITTYPRVDTTYLPDDVYPKCGNILRGLKGYSELLTPLAGKMLAKNKRIFDNSKITDHHAIIPTGQDPSGLTDIEAKVFDLIARRFIAAFYPDCQFEQTTVKATVGSTPFKVGGKTITHPGWRAVYASEAKPAGGDEPEGADSDGGETKSLPLFEVGESGPHKPRLAKKTTQPPKYYTEGTLLKAMETAGADVDDEDLREALKANGIGRPSTRAAIIETLFKRGYIRRERKSLRATEAGIDVVGLVKEELLKSAKLTGIWERRLRLIESGQYEAGEFVNQIKELVNSVIVNVLRDNSQQRIAAPAAGKSKPRKK